MMLTKRAVVSWAVFAGAMPLSLAFDPSFSRRNFAPRSTSPFISRHGVALLGDKKNLSASAQERREEEKRRLERKADVVIGKTSAKPDAQDFRIDPTATEQEWMRQASSVEQKVFRETEIGMQRLRLVRILVLYCLLVRIFL